MAADWIQERRMWTVTQIAAKLRCAVNTVRYWVQFGQLKGTKTSERGHWRVRAEDLRAFLLGAHVLHVPVAPPAVPAVQSKAA
jgi:excisionase family DNA binding protein